MRDVCHYLSFLLLNYCALKDEDNAYHSRKLLRNKFEVTHQWTFINFTWPTYWSYKHALFNFHYIPENSAPTGIKIYGGKIFISIPRFRPGIPVTLAYISLTDGGLRTNQLLNPYPNWDLNINRNCVGLQSVQSMEVDRQGYMWLIDGVRFNEQTKCPAKLVILDLRKYGKIIHIYNFPNEIVLYNGGFLNDIVLDDCDGTFAYMTDNSAIDPGLVVYSLKKNKAWKLRDRTMFAEPAASGFVVNRITNNNLIPIDGIALSPRRSNKSRLLYFCALTGLNLYSIDTQILKDETITRGDQWRKNITLVGKKEAQSDGLMIDNRGNLFYTLLPLYGIGQWNIEKPIETSRIIYRNKKLMVWPDTFAMDEKEYLYVISNNINKYINASYEIYISEEIKFRIFRYYTQSKSYMY
ncbi:hypothetical protein WA026_014757 [Henosepilachna vigintioctopunctata]|uniref:Uncharacterized protein n=1 Tax=Henosepilachna vigintioctopunctata TaxID=420089 RepID=A0AAW1V9Y4_9CUCU